MHFKNRNPVRMDRVFSLKMPLLLLEENAYVLKRCVFKYGKKRKK